MGNRWYDQDPKLSLAIGCINKANEKERNLIAKYIIKKCKAWNISINENRFVFFRRWYDHDKELSMAMEFFKNCDDAQKKQIAVSIIEMLTQKREELIV